MIIVYVDGKFDVIEKNLFDYFSYDEFVLIIEILEL